MSDEPVLNMGIIGDLIDMARDDDPQLISELLASFSERYPILLKQIRDGVAGNNPVDVRRASHSLKSCLASLGAQRASLACAKIEHAAREGFVIGSDREADHVEAEIGVALQALTEVVAREMPNGK